MSGPLKVTLCQIEAKKKLCTWLLVHNFSADLRTVGAQGQCLMIYWCWLGKNFRICIPLPCVSWKKNPGTNCVHRQLVFVLPSLFAIFCFYVLNRNKILLKTQSYALVTETSVCTAERALQCHKHWYNMWSTCFWTTDPAWGGGNEEKLH